MPRIREVETNDPIDLCNACFRRSPLKSDPRYEVTGDDHPPYSDTEYDCENCKKPLSDKDN